jgi:protein EFR3
MYSTRILDRTALLDQDDKAAANYLSDFRSRPAFERRALSIHAHIDGETGPSMSDVIRSCLQALSQLFSQSNGNQVGQLMQSAFESLDQRKGWEKGDHCRWFAQKTADWTQYQYRYAVPTRLVERLSETQDSSGIMIHRTLAGMITTVFTSPTPLINLSTSDIVSNFITLIIRRISVDPEDALIPDLVRCVAALGTHVYYADQIQDLAGELISRLLVVESSGVRTSSGLVEEKNRSQAIRALLSGLVGLTQAADNSEKEQEQETSRGPAIGVPSSPTKDRRESIDKHAHVKPSSRTRISPELWSDTLSLLCDNDYAVRADYADTLMCYLKNEISCQGDTADLDGVRRMRPLADGPMRQASNITAVLYGDSTTRFLSTLHAYIYILATTSTLGLNFSGSATSSTVQPVLTEEPMESSATGAPVDSAASQTTRETHSTVHPRRSLTVPQRARKTEVTNRFIDALPSHLSSTSSSISASDYAHILNILTAVQERVPVRGLLTVVPMLVTLDAFAKVEEGVDAMTLQRARAIKRVIANVCRSIGTVWECKQLVDLADQVRVSFP